MRMRTTCDATWTYSRVTGHVVFGTISLVRFCALIRRVDSFRVPSSSITSSLRPCSPQVLVWRSGPMNNREIQAAWKYHDGTKHSYWSVRNRPHFLDWTNRPLPFKINPKIDT